MLSISAKYSWHLITSSATMFLENDSLGHSTCYSDLHAFAAQSSVWFSMSTASIHASSSLALTNLRDQRRI